MARDTWHGTVTLLARIKVHTQQICGLAWSPDGKYFATGGNDNMCCLFSVDKILSTEADNDNVEIEVSSTPSHQRSEAMGSVIADLNSHNLRQSRLNPEASVFCPSLSSTTEDTINTYFQDINTRAEPDNSYRLPSLTQDDPNFVPLGFPPSPPIPVVKTWRASAALQTWRHLAAVKAIAFCPWRPSLLATGGGSNDKMIHFFHTTSGTTLATIAVSAQVTSLV